MNDNTSGQASDQKDKDVARHSYAKGTVVLRAIADELSEIALIGGGIREWELKRLHDRLLDVYQILCGRTVFDFEDETVIDGGPAWAWPCWDTYSDGTPVSIVVGPPSSEDWSAPDDVDDCGIPWNPSMANGYDADGPVPRGCAVMVVDPPHLRKSNTRAVCPETYSDSEALKARLREAKG
jgi:hypothetical protein